MGLDEDVGFPFISRLHLSMKIMACTWCRIYQIKKFM